MVILVAETLALSMGWKVARVACVACGVSATLRMLIPANDLPVKAYIAERICPVTSRNKGLVIADQVSIVELNGW